MAAPPPIHEEPARLPPVEQPQQVLRTVELFFTDLVGRRLFFRDAVLRRAGGGWTLMGSATARLGTGRNEGYGLGGVPGRWKDYYQNRSPTEFDLDADVAVLYADDNEVRERTYAADAELLLQTLGADWRTQITACADGGRRF